MRFFKTYNWIIIRNWLCHELFLTFVKLIINNFPYWFVTFQWLSSFEPESHSKTIFFFLFAQVQGTGSGMDFHSQTRHGTELISFLLGAIPAKLICVHPVTECKRGEQTYTFFFPSSSKYHGTLFVCGPEHRQTEQSDTD